MQSGFIKKWRNRNIYQNSLFYIGIKKVKMLSGAITMPESFTTTLSTLVENFTTSITNFVPTVILYGAWVVAILALMGLIGRKIYGVFHKRG